MAKKFLDYDGLAYLFAKIKTMVSGKADANHTHSAATTSAAGFMSKDDKSKLDGIATGANKTTVDSALNSTSTNPVQNKVINTALAGKANSSHGNHVPSTETANNAKFLRNDNTWQTVTPANIGAAASSHNHAASDITSGTLPATRGGTGVAKAGKNYIFAGPASGSDAEPTFRALVSDDIPMLYPSKIRSGSFSAKVTADSTSASDVEDPQIRDIYAGTDDMTAGSSTLATGRIYFVYE